MSSWGSPDGVAPDSDARHVSSGGGVPTNPVSLALRKFIQKLRMTLVMV